jgi:hypothetical protein
MTRLSVLFLFVICLPLNLVGQTQHPFKTDPKMEKQVKKGIRYKKQGDYKKAIKQFDKVLQKSPAYLPAMIEKASVYYMQNNLIDAAKELEKVNSIDSTYNAEIYFSLGNIYEQLQKKPEAVRSYRRFVNNSSETNSNHSKALENIKRLNFIIDAMSNPVPFEPYDPGPAINTPALEYLATLDIKAELMVFTRRIRAQEDLYYSIKESGEWSDAKPIKELNTPYNEAAHCISPDGNTLYFTKCEQRQTFGSCDLFVSKKSAQKWSAPQNMGALVNSASWDSQPVVSADGNTLYFSSTRPGGFGGRDIWYSTKGRDGNWSLPVNAGKTINTKRNEESPFLHADGKHLYFMSDGHLGLGGYDLFVSKKEKGVWTQPMNLGYPINTESDEGAIRVAPDGVTAYFSSDRQDLSGDGSKDLDIYAFSLYPEIQATPVSYVEGIVRDKLTSELLQLEISIFDNQESKWISDISSDYKGEFTIALPPGRDYNITIDHPGYVFHSEHFDLFDHKNIDTAFQILIDLVPLPIKGEPAKEPPAFEEEFVLKNIFFDSGSSILDTTRSGIELKGLVSFLSLNRELNIVIEGHTDSVGGDEDNMILSSDRANAVREYLVDAGISSSRIQSRGYGESRPLASNDTEHGRQLNRRTSFKIIE